MLHEVIVAGFGGQGVMSLGQLMAYAGMQRGYHVTWLPSYGPEQRGGTANCAVILSDEPVGAPVITHPSIAIVLNKPSFDKFEPLLLPHGWLLVNSSLIDHKTKRTDIQSMEIPANEEAEKLGNPRIANMLLLGAFLEITQSLTIPSIMNALKKILPSHRHYLLDLNQRALERGKELAYMKMQ